MGSGRSQKRARKHLHLEPPRRPVDDFSIGMDDERLVDLHDEPSGAPCSHAFASDVCSAQHMRNEADDSNAGQSVRHH